MKAKKTAKKTAAKKVVKKAVTKVAKKATPKALIFNKANAKAFADMIYSDNRGAVSFLKLCEGDLSNGKDGGRTLHCALGEAYFTFVHPDVAGFVKQVEKKHGQEIDLDTFDEAGHVVPNKKSYHSKYISKVTCDCVHTATIATVDALVDKAVTKNASPATKAKLAHALLETMQSNDGACGIDVETSLIRALEVSECWREKVIPLLK
jgi:hypothetical protein